MEDAQKLNWTELKKKYLYGSTRSVNAFLEAENVKINGFVTRKTKGWREEKESYEEDLEKATREKLIASLSDKEVDVRKRQASIAKLLQEIALKALESYKPKDFAEALRCLQIGLKEEREALNLNNNQPQVIYLEPAFMRTRYAQRLKNMNGDELLGVVKKLAETEKKEVVN